MNQTAPIEKKKASELSGYQIADADVPQPSNPIVNNVTPTPPVSSKLDKSQPSLAQKTSSMQQPLESEEGEYTQYDETNYHGTMQ